MDGASLLTVSLTSGETFTLAIGGQTEDGSYVYTALEAPAPGCDLFLISADKARTLSDLNYESLSADEEAGIRKCPLPAMGRGHFFRLELK